MNTIIKSILLSLFLSTGFSYAQKPNNMRTLDLQSFDKNNKDDVWKYETVDSIYVIEMGRGKSYLETITLKGTTLQSVYSYYNNGQLAESYNLYCEVPIGKTKVYNESGMLEKEIDNDKGYAFTMDDLRKLLLIFFKIDIKRTPELLTSSLRIGKDPFYQEYYIKNNKYIPTSPFKDVYTVFVPTIRRYEGHHLIIDGETGAILSHWDENQKELVKDPDYQKANEKYLHPTKKDSLHHSDWTPLVD